MLDTIEVSEVAAILRADDLVPPAEADRDTAKAVTPPGKGDRHVRSLIAGPTHSFSVSGSW